MARENIEVITCDVCSVNINNEDGTGYVRMIQDLNEEDGGYIDHKYSDVCIECTKSLMSKFDKWIEEREKA
jgi:hypothetical protein